MYAAVAPGCGGADYLDHYFTQTFNDTPDTADKTAIDAGTYVGDSWGYVDFKCVESGYFNINIRIQDIPWQVLHDAVLPVIKETLEALQDPGFPA